MEKNVPIKHIEKLRRRIKLFLVFFIIALCLSGMTAFPLEMQLRIGYQWLEVHEGNSALGAWIKRVYAGISQTNRQFPFIAYGTDWLGFAHIVIAVAFVGPLRDPVRNIWVIEFGLIAAVAVIPMAIVAGEVRGIPVIWRLIDCMFGVVGALVLLHCYRDTKLLEKESEHQEYGYKSG